MNILITSVGRRVSLVRAFQKELKAIFSGANVYVTDFNPKLSAACHVADHYFEVPKIDDESYIEVLIDLCKSNDIRLIIPTIDTELLLLAKHKERFNRLDIEVIISSVDFVQKCRNKREVHHFFESLGISIAKEYTKDNYSLPLFIKPIDGSRSVDTYLIRKESDLKEQHFTNDKFMFLEYLDHDIYSEFTCDLYYSRDHELKCVVPRKRLEVRDGEVYKALALNNVLVDYIKKHLKSIDGAIGCITAQFFLHNEDQKTIFAIEINPRFGGGYPLSYRAGANFPKWIIQEYLMQKEVGDHFDDWENNLLMIRYDDEILVHGYKG